MAEKDPGVGGPKMSKSDSGAVLEERNKSYEKVLDAQILYIRAVQEGKFDEIPNALVRWERKSEWHERTFGW